ncbi:MAG TPA: YafY family protein, partial [Spirochaetia bacterium]|nr:YafY family protein [Spirochaetia bacterium]
MYHPTGRVLTILELLQSRPGLSGPELAVRLETDVRTVRRYVTKLQDVGIPVESNPGRYGGYRLRPGYKLPPLIFDEQEAAAIVLGLLASTWLEVEQSTASVEGALSKITRVLPQAARDRVLAMSSVTVLPSASDRNRPDAALIMLLSEAVQRHTCAELDYETESGAPSHRVVEPYGLLGRQGKWYLVAFCRLRKDYRIFRLDRIHKAQTIDEEFAKNEDFDFRAYAIDYLENRVAKWRLAVVFAATRKALRERVPSSLGTQAQVPGGVRLEWSVDDLDYAARYLLTRG